MAQVDIVSKGSQFKWLTALLAYSFTGPQLIWLTAQLAHDLAGSVVSQMSLEPVEP